MCGGFEFLRHPERLAEEELLPALRGTGAGLAVIRVTFPNPRAALRVDPEQDLWLPWGRRRGDPGDWPEGGWARRESLDKAYWQRWRPVPVCIRAHRWMEKDYTRTSRWFDLEGRAVLCLRLDAAPGTPLYVVTEPAVGAYLAEVHGRAPVIVT